MHALLISLGVLWLVCLLIPNRPSKRVSSLSEEERLAWIERDRLAGFEKDRLARASPSFDPGGFSFMDD